MEDYLGMELELKPLTFIVDLGDKFVPEDKIKGFEICKILNDRVAVTFDTRSGYTGTGLTSLAIELVFDHKHFEICKWTKDEFTKFGKSLSENILQLTECLIKKYKEGSLIDIDGNEYCITKVTTPKVESAMIHITCGCNLAEIGLHNTKDRGFAMSYSDSLKPKANIRNFIYMLSTMCANNTTGNLECSDPKQQMDVMNRTSFGYIFSQLHSTEQEEIICFIQNFSGYPEKRITNYVGNIGDLERYFRLLKDNKINTDADPTFLANKFEKLGISALGDTTAGLFKLPIFEFRGCGVINLDKLDKYFSRVFDALHHRSDLLNKFNVNSVK